MLTRIPWSLEVDAALSHPAGRACVPYLREEVLRGQSKLYRFQDARDHAYLITRVDRNPTELVVCYIQGTGLAKFAPEIFAAARAAGIPIRVHTTQPAVVRLLRRYGLQVAETVLRWQ
jgi:hypothetical protein